MNTFVKLLLVAALVLLAIKLWPLAVFLLGALGLFLGLTGGVLSLALSGLLAVAVAIVTVLAVLALVLSPLWLTALGVFGLVMLIRKSSERPATVAG